MPALIAPQSPTLPSSPAPDQVAGPPGPAGPAGSLGSTERQLTIAVTTAWTDFNLAAACPGIVAGDTVTLVLQADLTVNSIVPPSAGFWCFFVVRDQSGGNWACIFKDSGGGGAANQFRTPHQPFGGAAVDYVMQSEEETCAIVHTATSASWRIISGPAGTAGVAGPAGPAGPAGAAGPQGVAGSVALVQAITASVAATAATTNLSFGTFTIPAGVAAGTVFRATGHFTQVKTVSTTVMPIIELVVGGVVVATATTDSIGSVAETYGAVVQAFFTVKTTGAGGTCDGAIAWPVSYRLGDSDKSAPADKAINTTISNVLEMRIRMAAAVAANTLTVRQGFYERVI